MIGAVIVTHGKLASELAEAMARIVGPTDGVCAVTLGWDDEVSDAKQQIQDAIAKVDQGSGVLVFTDMFGGTPTNVSLAFLEPERVEIITGVNLPMLVKLTSLQQQEQVPLLEAAQQVRDRGQKSIYVASEILSSKDPS
jgi:PTS system mannose-specific IIA component